MKLGLVRIILSLGQILGKVFVVPRDRVIIAQIAVTAQNLFDHLLTVNDVFESQPDIVVVIGLHGGQHGDGVMPGPFQF